MGFRRPLIVLSYRLALHLIPCREATAQALSSALRRDVPRERMLTPPTAWSQNPNTRSITQHSLRLSKIRIRSHTPKPRRY